MPKKMQVAAIWFTMLHLMSMNVLKYCSPDLPAFAPPRFPIWLASPAPDRCIPPQARYNRESHTSFRPLRDLCNSRGDTHSVYIADQQEWLCSLSSLPRNLGPVKSEIVSAVVRILGKPHIPECSKYCCRSWRSSQESGRKTPSGMCCPGRSDSAQLD